MALISRSHGKAAQDIDLFLCQLLSVDKHLSQDVAVTKALIALTAFPSCAFNNSVALVL